MATIADHGPASTWVGSQSRLPPESRYGAEPSGGGLAGGARAALEHAGLQAGEALRDRQRHELRRPDGQLLELEGVEDRLDARVVAVGVVVGRAGAEVAEPADELRDVRAG